jgi:hypothetical protein
VNLTAEHLGRAQDRIQEAAQRIAEVTSRFTANSDWGTQRVDYLTQALVQLNNSWSLIRAATNESPTVPAVRPIPPALIQRTATRKTKAKK